MPSRIAFSTLAFPDATLAAAASAAAAGAIPVSSSGSSTASSSTRPCPPRAGRRSGGSWPRPGCRSSRWTARSASPTKTPVPSCAGSSSWPATGRPRWCGCSAARSTRRRRAGPGSGARRGCSRRPCRWPPGSASPSAWRPTTLSPPPRPWPSCWPWSTVGRPVGAVWDSHHPHRMGETPAEVYANIGPRILLAQVKDARRIGAVLPGTSRARTGMAAGAARRRRGTGEGHARPAGGRRLPALDLGRMGEALAPRDRGARGGPPPAPGPAGHVARAGQ